eukprot:11494252-Karenia_brevis.AAC.1
MDLQSSAAWSAIPEGKIRWLCGHFDGGKRGEVAAACGWHLQAYTEQGSSEPRWLTIAWGRILLPGHTTTVEAELYGLVQVSRAALSFVKFGRISFDGAHV